MRWVIADYPTNALAQEANMSLEEYSEFLINSCYLDLEDYFYRPVLLKFLPTVCAAVCLVIDRFVDGVVIILPRN